MAGKNRARGGSSHVNGGRDRRTDASALSQPPSHSIAADNIEADNIEADNIEADQDIDEGSSRSRVVKKPVDPVLVPGHNWFGKRCISNIIGECIREHYKYPYMNYSETPQEVRDQWLNIFRNFFKWTPDLDNLVRKEFDDAIQHRLKSMISRAGKGEERPDYITEPIFKHLKRRREDPKFKERSARAEKNKKAAFEDGKPIGTHHFGSISAVEVASRMTLEKKGETTTAYELFLKGQSIANFDGTRKILTRKAKKVNDTFISKKNELEKQGEEVMVDKIYFEAVGGRKKGKVFGLGSAEHLYYSKTSGRQSTVSPSLSYTPGLVKQIEERLTQQFTTEQEKMKNEITELREAMQQLVQQQANNKAHPLRDDDAFDSRNGDCNP